MKILIIGATGFIGKSIYEALRKKAYEIKIRRSTT